MSNIFENFLSNLDAVEFIEQNLILEGKQFLYTDNGHDFAKQIIRYCCHTLPYSKKGKPVAVLKGRQVGLSTLTAAISLYFMYAEDHKSFLHCFPQVGHARTHSSKRLIELIEDSIKKGKLPQAFLNSSSTATQSLEQKDFQKSNTLYIKGTSVDGRRLRGTSVSGLCLMDEFASMTSEAFRNVLECSANTHFGFIDSGKQLPHVIFGTPEAEGSLFDNIWERSNKQLFFFKCPHCSHQLPLFYDIKSRTEVFTNLVSGTLIRCLDQEGRGCQKLFDKNKEMSKGEWKATIEPGKDYDYTGFWVPQFLNGMITRESIDQKRLEYPTRQFYNEVLGKFYSSEEEALSRQDIIRYTTTKPSTLEWELPPHVLDRKTFMGIDWGARVSGVEDTGSGSYTAVTIFSLMPTGQLKLEHASKLSTKDTDEKVKQVTELMKRYNVLKCVADRGFGESEWQRLQKIHGQDKFTANAWGGNSKRSFIYSQDINLITSDKHVIHEMFFDELKQNKFCIPYSMKAEAELEWLFDHISNIEVLTVSQNGMIKKQYRKKQGKETDGLASLVFAYTAFQFWKTNGFSVSPGAMGGSSLPGSKGSSGLQPYAVMPALGMKRGSSDNNGRPHNYSRSDRRRR